MSINASEYFKCISCNSSTLQQAQNKLICKKCTQEYEFSGNIYRFLLQDTLTQDKTNEITTRDAQAEFYDTERPSDYLEVLTQHNLNVIQNICHSNTIAIDLACGTGRTSLQLAKTTKFIFCVDFSLKSLQILRDKAQAQNISNLIFVQADVNFLPFKNEELFDFINAVEFFQHIPNFSEREKLLSDIWSYLKKSGHLYLTAYFYGKHKRKYGFFQDKIPGEFGKHGYHGKNKIYYYNYSTSELHAMLTRANFEILKFQLFYFNFPIALKILQKILHVKRTFLEEVFYRFIKNRANRIFFLSKK